jgi:hypothetical protein
MFQQASCLTVALSGRRPADDEPHLADSPLAPMRREVLDVPMFTVPSGRCADRGGRARWSIAGSDLVTSSGPDHVPPSVADGVRPVRRNGGVMRYGQGRVCFAPGCTTRLSVYNADTFCWMHQRPVPQPGRALRP